MTYDPGTDTVTTENSLTPDEQESLEVGEALQQEQEGLLAGKYRTAEELEKALNRGADLIPADDVEYSPASAPSTPIQELKPEPTEDLEQLQEQVEEAEAEAEISDMDTTQRAGGKRPAEETEPETTSPEMPSPVTWKGTEQPSARSMHMERVLRWLPALTSRCTPLMRSCDWGTTSTSWISS